MQLSTGQIKEMTFGKIGVTESTDGIAFERFTRAQASAFDHCHDRWHPFLNDDYFLNNCSTDSCVMLDMMTDAREVTFRISSITPANDSTMTETDLLVDGHFRQTIRTAGNCTVRLRPTRDGRLRRVTLVFPYFARLVLSGVTVNDGAYVCPVHRSGLWLALGDSITHGVCASSPSRTYMGRMAISSGMEVINQANSGYVHDARVLAPLPDGRQPDLVTVAYGINDWGVKSRDANRTDMIAFYEKLTGLYPSARILMLSPVWAVFMGGTPMTTLGDMYAMFTDVQSHFASRVTLIDGLSLVPHRPELFCPDGVHPNDAGFSFYASRLSRHIARSIRNNE